jgi:hypothetical protein
MKPIANQISTKVVERFSRACLIPKPSAWVYLWEPQSDYDEAWLMCKYDDGKWAAWIPDLGVVTLDCEQFCRLT